jgi:outer membrane protein
MKKKTNASFFRIIILVILMIPFIPSNGSTESVGDVMTLKQAISLAISNNQDLKQAKDQVLTSEINHDQSRTNFYPDLTAKAGTSYGRNTLSIPDDKTYRSLNSAITSTLNLFNGYNDQVTLKKSVFSMKSDKEAYDRMIQTVVYNTITAYLNAVQSKENIRVAEENLTENQKQLELIEAFYKAGRKAVVDYYQQEAQTASAQLDLLNAQQAYKTNKMQLLKAIGISAMTPFELVNFSDDLVPVTQVADTDSLIKTALSNRPDILAQKDKVSATDMAIRQAEAGYYPVVDFVASLSSSYSSLDNSALNDQLNNGNMAASVGINVQIPVFDRFLTRNQVSLAKIASNTVRLDLEKLQRQIEVDIGEAVSNYQAAVKQVEVAQLQLSYSAKALESTRLRYKAGAATLSELTQSQANYIQAQYNKVNAGLHRVIQSVSLDFYKGDMNGLIRNTEKNSCK